MSNYAELIGKRTVESKNEKNSSVDMVSVRNIVNIPLKDGQYEGEFVTFNGLSENEEHFAIGFGNWRRQRVPPVRIHSECLTGDTFSSTRCDCGKQLDEAIEKMASVGGLILYMRQEGRGIGLYNKIDAYKLQNSGYDTYEANRKLHLPDDMRSYKCASEMLVSLGIKKIRLLSNNPDKKDELSRLGIQIDEVERTGVFVNKDNFRYLLAKSVVTAHNIALSEV